MIDTIIKINQGELLGKIFKTDDGFEYLSFSGIPYAKPPIGPLRFRAPQPPDGWVGLRDATAEGDVFIQMDLVISNEPIGSEDGLFINVNVPRNRHPDKKLPVMVYVFGGAFHKGSGNKEFLGPDYLVQKDVIVVTFNYRVGILGFLCLNTAEVPGNAGLKDQVMALQWVRDNIENFGGDRNNVNLFGSSSGSASITYLMISPMAEGLFHRVIIQSGTCFSECTITKNPEESAFKYAERFGFKGRAKNDLLQILRAAPASELVDMKGFIMFDKFSFTPVIEKHFQGVPYIIKEHPRDIFMQRKFKTVPCIIGFASEDGIQEIPLDRYHLELPLSLEEVNAAFDFHIPSQLCEEKQKIARDILRKQYFSPEKDYIKSFIDMKSDTVFLKPIDDLVKLLARGDQPVYYYNFGYHGSYNIITFALRYPYKGAAHADELGYIFKMQLDDLFQRRFKDNPHLAPKVKMEEMDRLISKRIVNMWTNFAKYGNPTPETNDIITTIWKPITPIAHYCLEINDDLKMSVNPLQSRMEFWDEFPKILL